MPPVVCFSFCRRAAPNRRQQSGVVGPVHTLQGGQLHGFPGLTGSQRGITLGLVQHVDDLSQRVVIAVDTTCPPKRPYARLDRAFGERIETY